MFSRSKDKVNPIYNSLQIWYQGQEDNVNLDLDINIWRLKTAWKRKIYLDFGIRVKDPKSVEKIFIYFPFEIDSNKVIDLGKELSNVSLLNGIFNENYEIRVSAKTIYVKEETSANTLFSIYQLDVEKDITIKKQYSGTILSFEVKSQNYPKYYRFRVANEKYGTLSEKYKPKNSFFDSAFIETEIIDFRINEKRNQDSSLMEEMEDGRTFHIDNVNFFVMSPIQDEIESDGINLVYKRQLEMGNFWGEYLKNSYKRMSVYKCKTSEGKVQIDDFNCFCKIKYRKSNIASILIYLLVLGLLSVMFNILSNLIWTILSSMMFGGA